jgi:hypothetical protein
MDDRDRKDEERTEESEAAEPVEDLDVPEGESDDVKGGYSFKQGWPKKYEG